MGNVRKTHIGSATRPTSLYSLDVILSVGYRTNSKNATVFRRWAGTTLKVHLTQGYSVNEKKLEQLNFVLKVLERTAQPEISGVSNLISDYTQALLMLENYDAHSLPQVKGTTATWQLTYDEVRKFLDNIKSSGLFAKERTGQFKEIVE